MAEAVALRLLEAWNKRDIDGFIGLLAEDIEWYDPAMPQPPVRGRQAVREFVVAVLEAFPDFVYEVDHPICVSADGSRCAVSWKITATHSGVLQPMGFAPTARRGTFEGVDVLDVRDGKVTRIHTAFDPIFAAEQFTGFTLRPRPGSWRAAVLSRIQRVAAWIARGRRS